MTLKLFQIDAFTDRVFGGNPAAVCPLESWLDDKLLQNIAAENNLAETVYFIKTGEGFEIRWFTPKAEVDLCGHATIAAAHVIFNHSNFKGESISFQSRSGELKVKRTEGWYVLDFPADILKKTEVTAVHNSCFTQAPLEVYEGRSDLMFIYDSEEEIKSLQPRLAHIASLPARGIIITAKGSDTDFVSRFFAPAFGISEDPVTGSAHTTLIPYWSQRLHKTELTARQLSERGGYIKGTMLGERVEIAGQAAFYMAGEIEV
jgi:PhzF family phenazine biosynthesis protein